MSDEHAQITDERQAPYDAGNPEHVERKRKKIKVTEDAANVMVRGLMKEPEGRAFFWWLLGQCGAHTSSFSQNGLAMAFAEGRRDIGLRIEAKIAELAPDDFVLMQREAREKSDA